MSPGQQRRLRLTWREGEEREREREREEGRGEGPHGVGHHCVSLSSSAFPVCPQPQELLRNLALIMRMLQLIFLAYERAMISLLVCMNSSPSIHSNMCVLLQRQSYAQRTNKLEN